MDGGIDDALAILLALQSQEMEVLGITAVSGNVPVEQAATNALRVRELVNVTSVWIAKGQARPLSRDPIRAYQFHGKDGLGDSNLPRPKIRSVREKAIDMMRLMLHSARRRELTIICTGPLTNLATFIRKFPEAKRAIDEVVIMGGAYGATHFGIGNETPVAEFNICSDPEAAKIVFESGVNLKAVGLDVTTIPQLELTEADYGRIARAKGPIARFSSRILSNNIRDHGRFTLHDPMAVAFKIRPSYYNFTEYPVSIETRGEYTTGMTIADRRYWLPQKRRMGNRVGVCTKVNDQFKQLFMSRLFDPEGAEKR